MSEIKHEAAQYVYIMVWGRHLGSSWMYIHGEQRLAARQGAPLTAVYRSPETDEWVTVENLQDRAWFDRLCKRAGVGG